MTSSPGDTVITPEIAKAVRQALAKSGGDAFVKKYGKERMLELNRLSHEARGLKIKKRKVR